ncbi:MAG TPA: glycosyltransferase [Symbiobacteriaceae bacterium]|nr:glycosyltransferase [Symbiobacteriaceae bacterium]
MLAVVVPAMNEAARIQGVLRSALKIPADLVIPVLNGCTDMTAEMVRRVPDSRIRPIHFREPLGLDVPRIAGAQEALKAGARAVLFVDGDLEGPIQSRLTILTTQVKKGALDLALSDCYSGTPVPSRQSLARQVYTHRVALNEALNRRDLGAAMPSHGPVAVSRKLLEAIPLSSLGVPPLMQAHACRAGLKVGVGVCIPHQELGSTKRDREHRQRVAETIIGDCLQATAVAEGRPGDRGGYDGYHRERRFDLVGLNAPEGVTPVSRE